MADFTDLPLKYRAWLAVYPWRRIDPVPWTPLPVPLTRATVAIVTSAGIIRPGIDAPFARGDPTERVIPGDVDVAALAIAQPSDAFDPAPSAADHNLAFPLDRLRHLAARGEIGAVAPRHISFNGSLPSPGRMVRDTAPRVAALLRADRVDAALFVPI